MRAALRAVLLRGASTGLDLNFAGGVFSLNNTRTDSPANIPGWTFSRTDTNGTATALDLAGNVIQFATGVPRITNRGILVEEARTNKGTSHNANPTEAAGFVGNPVNMSKSGDAAGILSVVDDAAALAAAGLSGACTSGKAYKLDNTAGAANAIASINGTVGNLNAHAFSCYARATAGSGSVGRSGSSVGAATFSSSAYARVSAVLTPTATTEVLRVQALPGAVVYFILAQLEEGAFATSPIITTGAAGTRNGDQPAAGTSVLPPEGTIVLTYTVPPTAAGAAERLYGWRTEDSGNSRLALRIGDAGNNTAPAMVIGDGAAVSTLTGSNLTPGTTAKVACSYSTLSAQAALCVNGTDQTVARQTASSMLSTLFQIGQSSGDFSASSPLLRLQIIPRFLTAAERIALTAP
jgi:hypothetical protein